MAERSAADKLNDFFQTATRHHYQKGEVILHAGDTPAGVDFIASGYVKVYSIRSSGDLSLHVIYKPGELFPLIWAYRNTILNVYYEAMDEVVCYRAPRDSFRSFIYAQPAVTELMLEQLSQVHWIYVNRVENLELARAHDKVLYRLHILAERFGLRMPSGEVLIQAPVTHKDIADSTNMIRETASREMAKLEKEGLVASDGRHIIIRKPKQLRSKLNLLR